MRRRIYFNDIFQWIGVEALANRFSRLYECHFAFIVPAGSIVWELEALKEGYDCSSNAGQLEQAMGNRCGYIVRRRPRHPESADGHGLASRVSPRPTRGGSWPC